MKRLEVARKIITGLLRYIKELQRLKKSKKKLMQSFFKGFRFFAKTELGDPEN